MEERMKYIVEFITSTALFSLLIYAVFSLWSFDLLWILHTTDDGIRVFIMAVSFVILFRFLCLVERINLVRKKEEREDLKLSKMKTRLHYIDLHIGLLEHKVFSLRLSDLERCDEEQLRTMFYMIYSDLRKIRNECNTINKSLC